MPKLRDLVEDRSARNVLPKKVHSVSLVAQRDTIHQLLQGRKLETLGKLSDGFRSIVLPCLESIQEDVYAISIYDKYYRNSVNNSKTLLQLRAALSEYSNEFIPTPEEQGLMIKALAANVSTPVYLLQCGVVGYVSLSKSFTGAITKILETLKSIDVAIEMVGELCSCRDNSYALRMLDHEQTKLAVAPVYGRQSDAQQLRALKEINSSLDYCDPIGAPDDFWISADHVFETSLFPVQRLDLVQVVLQELHPVMSKLSSVCVDLKKTTLNYLGEAYTAYVDALIDRILALTLLISAIRKLACCSEQFSRVQFELIGTDLLSRLDKVHHLSDYHLILNEFKQTESQLLV